MQHNRPQDEEKDSTGELFRSQYLVAQGGSSSGGKKIGELNGLESTENRRSLGRHGNQHVYVRDPQVSGSSIFRSSAGGSPGLASPR